MQVVIDRREQIVMPDLQPLALVPVTPDIAGLGGAHVLHQIGVAGEEGIGAYADEFTCVVVLVLCFPRRIVSTKPYFREAWKRSVWV